MDLYEACENGNEERVVELLVLGDTWIGSRRTTLEREHAHDTLRHRSTATSAQHEITAVHTKRSAAPRHSLTRAIESTGTRKANTRVSAATVAASAAGFAHSPREVLHARGTAGRTPLHAACMGGQVGAVRLLLGEPCCVYFTSRTEQETIELLAPLRLEHQRWHSDDSDALPSRIEYYDRTDARLFAVHMATKDDSSDSDCVPVAIVQLPPERTISPQDLLAGRVYVDDFGNTPLQCISCFGCGTTERHIDDSVVITQLLLQHGDQPNVPKHADNWTPLHWAAFHGNHEQVALLLDPHAAVSNKNYSIGKTQRGIPLLVTSDDLFAVDVAGRRGLVLQPEMQALRRLQRSGHTMRPTACWRLRLSHYEVISVLICDFVQSITSHSLVHFVNAMNERLPLSLLQQRRRQQRQPITLWFTRADALRYGQHLLYWASCFGLVDAVRSLLALQMDDAAARSDACGTTKSNSSVSLAPLYVCACEEHKRQSALHAAASLGQCDVVALLLAKLVADQQRQQQRRNALGASARSLLAAATSKHKLDNRATKSAAVAPIRASDDDDDMSPINADASDVVQAETDAMHSELPPPRYSLDALALVDSGWRNARRETPLFLAVLYFQHDVVALFVRVLSHASVAFERTQSTVEGSFLYHVATDDATRKLLGLANQQQQPCAEYVLLFDAVRHRAFKEMVVETVREASATAPSLVVTRAGTRVCGVRHWLVERLTVSPAVIDYIVVGATTDVLARHASALELKVKHRGSTRRSTFCEATSHRFEPLRSLQRQHVVLDILQKNVNVEKHVRLRHFAALFPLHDAIGCQSIQRHWVVVDLNDSSNKRCLFQPFVSQSGVRQFLFERRTHAYEMLWPLLTYFGEKHAFYYAFVAFYAVWLALLAVPSVVCQLLVSLALDVDSAIGAAAPPVFAIGVSIWATLFVERWKRKKSEIAASFGCSPRANRHEHLRAFYGDFQVGSSLRASTRSTATATTLSSVDIRFPKAQQLLRIYCGIPILLSMAAAVVAVFVSVKAVSTTSSVALYAPSWLPSTLLPYVIPFANAVSMLVLDTLYTTVALALTQWENHRTVWQYESMLAAKLFWFKFLNAFLSLFWVAFVDRDAAALRKQLVTLMGVRQVWFTASRHVWPLVRVQWRWRQRSIVFRTRSVGREKAKTMSWWFTFTPEWYNAELTAAEVVSTTGADATHTAPASSAVPVHVLVQEMMLPPDLLLTKQMELVLQFGYVTMFVSVLPAVPVLALLANVVNTRLDVICCTQVKQRPPFESATEVETFTNILAFMSFAAVAVNCAVLFFTTQRDLERVFALAPSVSSSAHATGNNDAGSAFYLTKLWTLLAIEHVVLGAKALLALTIEDAATWVTNDDDDRRNDDDNAAHYTSAIEEKENNSNDSDGSDSRAALRAIDKAHGIDHNETDCQGDKLFAEVHSNANDADVAAATSKRATHTASALDQVLAEKYSAAVKERDGALQRERAANNQLRACMLQLAQQQQQLSSLQTAPPTRRPSDVRESLPLDTRQITPTTSGDESLSPRTVTDASALAPINSNNGIGINDSSVTATILPHEHPTHNVRVCLLCALVRGVKTVAAAKRCLSCRAFLCRACDATLHLDDLGIREPLHFRVNVSKSSLLPLKPQMAMLATVATAQGSDDSHQHCHAGKHHGNQIDGDVRSECNRAGVAHPRSASQTELDELYTLVNDYVTAHNEVMRCRQPAAEGTTRAATNVLPLLDPARVYASCTINARLVLRYLRNEHRCR